MKQKFLQKTALFMIVLFALGIFPVAAAQDSQIPTDSYTYWITGENDSDRKSVYSRPMYEVSRVIDNAALGIPAFSELTDVYSDPSGQTYILDGGAGNLIVLNSDYTLKCNISKPMFQGETLDFTGARGVYASDENNIYIADTKNARIIICRENGEVHTVVKLPDSEIIPDEFQYRPIKVAVDSKGYLYAVSEGSYYGAVKYSETYEFLGFYGSNSVGGSVLQALEKIRDMLTNNNTKRSADIRRLPYQFVDLDIDSADFVYTITGHTSGASTATAQIKKFSIGGTNILRRTDSMGSKSSESINFGEPTVSKYAGKTRIQDFLGISVNRDGFIFGLDSTYGKIYVYDSQCNLLTVFGGGIGTGGQIGTFRLAEAITVNGDEVLVCDSGKNTVTVFERTRFGKLVQQADLLTQSGNHDEAELLWKKALQSDANCQLAYRGIAKARFYAGDYHTALTYAEIGNDKDVYSQAFGYVRNEYIARNFWWIALIVLAAIGALVTFMILTSRHKKILIRNKKLRTMLRSPFHPFESFREIKEHNGGSLALACGLVFLWYAFSVLEYTKGGFLYTEFEASSFNALFILAKTVGLIVLWTLVNWAVCTLMDGKGKLKEVFIAAAYCTLPLSIKSLLFIVLSNTLTLEQAAAINAVSLIAVIFCGMMLCIGTIVIHDYSFGKFVGTGLLTLAGIGLAVFVIFMIVVLLQQFYIFASTVFMEAFYR